MIDSKKLLTDLESKKTSRTTMVKRLEDDLRKRCDADPQINAPLKARYDEAKKKGRTAFTYKAWREDELTQIAVAWVLGCVFVRFLEDNELVETPKLSGPGLRLQRARDEYDLYFRRLPEDPTDRGYLIEVFEEVGRLPGMREFFDKKHNPLWLAAPSGDACRELLQFWQKTDPATGALLHDFTDPEWNTRFLGDLYQDLSEAARKKYALLQTPDFVEEFILDRTLTPAIETFGYRVVRLIDPTCGSGHFLLGTFARLFRIWQDECPGENPRVLAQRALDAACGVDLNPFAVAIARFRLLLAALQVSGIKQLRNAPDFQIHLATGDSLIHGARFDAQGKPYTIARDDMFGGDEAAFKDELAHFFDTEDSAELHRILGQQYHAVVGNPPYITVKDTALNELYRGRYDSCHRKYSLSLPFMERIFDLALSGSPDGRGSAGFTGQITANSFMKREFGKKIIEQYIPRWDLTHVLDTSGAYIPGHGTPTVILFGRNTKPVAPTVRTVMGIKGETATPENPAKGKVWSAIVDQIDRPGSESEFVSAADTEREKFLKHPWSIGGGGASELRDLFDDDSDSKLEAQIEAIGFLAIPGDEDVFVVQSEDVWIRKGARKSVRRILQGDCIRDFGTPVQEFCIFPYNDDGNFVGAATADRHFWHFRAILSRAPYFGKTKSERGLDWREYAIILASKFPYRFVLVYPNIATHNHFAIADAPVVSGSTALAITFGAEVTREHASALSGVMNSSCSCFWMKQIFFPKGGDHVGQEGARVRKTLWDERYQVDGTKLKQFPVPDALPERLGRELDRLAQELSAHSPDALVAREVVSAADLAEAEQQSALLRARMISLQEELDWQCYRHYGLIETDDALEWPEERLDALPPLSLGERAFEIRMARQMADGDLESTWFERHKDAGSKPITTLPAHWQDDYRALVERRLAFIDSNKNLNLIERPEYKRRWNTEPWAKRQQEALKKWLLARLEGYFFEGERVSKPDAESARAALSFTAAARPHLVSANQLADAVQSDARFLEAAEVYEGAAGFSLSKLIRSLVESESVPYLPRDRYQDSGLRKRQDWEETWKLQRVEDEIDADTARLDEFIESRIMELVNRIDPNLVGELDSALKELERADEKFHQQFFPKDPYDSDKPHHKRPTTSIKPGHMSEWLKLDSLANALAATERYMTKLRSEVSSDDGEVIHLKELKDRLSPKPDIAVPPKYAGIDFEKTSYWKLRGKLDVPKERWITYPGAERAGDDSLPIAWAGWDHLQQAQALAGYFIDARDNQAFTPDRLKSLLAGLADLIPWLQQWHNTLDPDLGMGLGDYFAGFLEEQCRALGMTVTEVDGVRFGK